MPKQAQPLIPLLCTQCGAAIKLTETTIKKVFQYDSKDGNIIISVDAEQPIICPHCETQFITGDAFKAPTNVASLNLALVGAPAVLVVNGNNNSFGNGNIHIGNVTATGESMINITGGSKR